jgi:hypothetical protein
MASLRFTKLSAEFRDCMDVEWCFCFWFRLILLRSLTGSMRGQHEHRDDTSGKTARDAKDRFETVSLHSHLLPPNA